MADVPEPAPPATQASAATSKREPAGSPVGHTAAIVERVVLAEIHRERGNRGEVIARSLTDIPGRLENLKSAWVHLADGTDRAVSIDKVWRHQENWVLKFTGVDSISAAEQFRRADLWVPRAERASLPDGEYYESDLLGFAVLDAARGEAIGFVRGWQRFGGPPLLEVEYRGREVLIPFVPAICRNVDLEGRTLEVDLPEGLLEL